MADDKDFMGGMFDLDGNGKTDDLETAFAIDYMLNDEEESHDNTNESGPIYIHSEPQAAKQTYTSYPSKPGPKVDPREQALKELEQYYQAYDYRMKKNITKVLVGLILCVINALVYSYWGDSKWIVTFSVIFGLVMLAFCVLGMVRRKEAADYYCEEKARILSKEK